MNRFQRLGRAGKVLVAVAVAGVMFGIASAVQASIPDSSGVIHGCYNKKGAGELRVIDTSAAKQNSCSKSEAALNWNQTGVKGATGVTGPSGPEGPSGPSGPGAVQIGLVVDAFGSTPRTQTFAVFQGFSLSLTCDPSTATVSAITMTAPAGFSANGGWNGSAGQSAFDGQSISGFASSVNMATGAAANSAEGGMTFEAYPGGGTGHPLITGQLHWKTGTFGGGAFCAITGALMPTTS